MRGSPHRGAALLDGGEALFHREVLLEDLRRVLDLPAAGTREVAAKERLEHEDERITLSSTEPLREHVRRDRPHLRNRN